MLHIQREKKEVKSFYFKNSIVYITKAEKIDEMKLNKGGLKEIHSGMISEKSTSSFPRCLAHMII